MASISAESVVQDGEIPVVGSPQSPSRMIPPPFEEQHRSKLKGRQRLLAGLQRISSSQSLSRLSGVNARGYNGNGQGSMSCISLASANSLHSPSLAREYSYGFSTAPTSGANTPGIQIPAFDERARVRYLSNLDQKASAQVPADVRSTPKSPLQPDIAEVDEDYFSKPVTQHVQQQRKDFNFWRDLPSELRMEVLTYLEPRQIVQCG